MAKMSLLRRVKFVCQEYWELIPAIYRSWRSPAYPPPTREEMLAFTAGVDVTPTCTRVLPQPQIPQTPYREHGLN